MRLSRPLKLLFIYLFICLFILLVCQTFDLRRITCVFISILCDKLYFLPFCFLQLPLLSSIISHHQRAAFFSFSLLSPTSFVLQWHHEEGNFCLGYVQSNFIFSAIYYLREYIIFPALSISRFLLHLPVFSFFLSNQQGILYKYQIIRPQEKNSNLNRDY